ncbi:DUF2189 domain-containing protein [Maricaulis sp.]|uniref:DUF2189 domain-containing protein n=1 Tax=Maricaulis sp. TaxID=1486257 RepID=UPI001B1ACBFD|nr:DUF2189 domain-containing protein [Maricaulis sp.]MBO6798413.1 DUF2189 domain-containing protein [Maricaulis sp.]
MVTLKKVRRDAPWKWLKLGFEDLRRAPLVSISYGLIFVLGGLAISGTLWAFGGEEAIPVALSGFALISTALAIGIYQVSRAFERGEKPRFRVVISRYPSRISQVSFMSVILVMLLLWFHIAQTLRIVLAPSGPFHPGEFIQFMLTAPEGMTFMIIGTITGAILAAFAFTISVLSFPMLIDQDVDAVTALVASFRSVLAQPFVMITWAWLIAFMVVAGSAVFTIGLAFTFLWIAHASCYAYKDFEPRPEPSASAAKS